MYFSTNSALKLQLELDKVKEGTADDQLKVLHDALQDARGSALVEVAEWHGRRADTHLAFPRQLSEIAKSERRVMAQESHMAANYFRKLPDAEASRDQPADVGSDGATAAFRLLYERQFGESNQDFLVRAEKLIDSVCEVAVNRAINNLPKLEDGFKNGWRLDRIEFFGTDNEKYKVTLFQRGGETLEGLGSTTLGAVADARRKLEIHENKELPHDE